MQEYRMPAGSIDAQIALSEELLRDKQIEESRAAAEPVVRFFHAQQRPLTPRLERLFAVFVFASTGNWEALKLLDLPLPE